MKEKPNIAIIGAGAVGSFYGAKLLHHKYSVQFQSKTSSKKMQNKTMKIQSIWGDFEVEPSFFKNTTQMKKADIIIMSMKVIGQIDYKIFLDPIINRETIILCLFNGINEEEKIQKIYPKNIILGGLAFTCINRISSELISHTDYGMIKIGASQKEDIKYAEYLESIFQHAKIEVIVGFPLRQFRWQKLLWNIPFNSLSVILNGVTTDKIINNKEMLELSRALMRETKDIANYEGYDITEKDIEQMITNTQKMESYKTSMMLDFVNNKKMEVETIVGEPIRLAEKYKIFIPNMKLIYQILKYHNMRVGVAHSHTKKSKYH